MLKSWSYDRPAFIIRRDLRKDEALRGNFQGGAYVGSKNSNKFHLPTCPGAKTISDANKIWFQTKEEAIAKGYVPASNCKGI